MVSLRKNCTQVACVPDYEDKLSEWVWTQPGYHPDTIVMIWMEGLTLSSDGTWQVEIELNPDYKSSGQAFDPIQVPRAQDRNAALQRLWETKKEFVALLQIDKWSREQREKGKAANAVFRAQDTGYWHVSEIRPGTRGYPVAVLRRGQRGQALHRESNASTPISDHPIALAAPATGQEAEVDGWAVWRGFPDADKRKAIETAAVEYVIKKNSDRYDVRSVESLNLGYDLEFVDRTTGAITHKVEVKGASGKKEAFYLSRNEFNCAKSDPLWRLHLVTSALQDPNEQVYRRQEMLAMFDMDPMAYRCAKPKSTSL